MALAALAGSLINLPISCYLTSRIGVAGVIWGTVLTTFFSNLLVPGLYVFRVLEIDLRTYLRRTLSAAFDRGRGTCRGDLVSAPGHADHLSGHCSLDPCDSPGHPPGFGNSGLRRRVHPGSLRSWRLHRAVEQAAAAIRLIESIPSPGLRSEVSPRIPRFQGLVSSSADWHPQEVGASITRRSEPGKETVVRTFALISGLLAIACTAGAAEATDQTRIGAAAVVITPPLGTPMAGYYFDRAAEGVHDELFAKALVLEQGGTRAALVSLDLISTPMGLVEEIRKEIDRSTGVPGRNVMISATHAHTGPVLAGRGLRDDAPGPGTAWLSASRRRCRSRLQRS